MKKLCAGILMLLVVFLSTGCKKTEKPSDIFTRMSRYAGANIEDDPVFYTRGTIEVMDELRKLMPESSRTKAENIFAGRARWVVVDETVTGDTAVVKIRFREHPSETMKGAEMDFRLKKEDGMWKIDMEQERRQALDAMKSLSQF